MLLKETLTEEEGLGDGEGKSYHKAVFRSFTVLPLSSNDLVVTKENFICRSRYLSLNLRFLTFPNLRQTYDYDCGATVVQAVLAYYGIHIRKDHIMKIAGTSKRDGTSLSGILKVLKKQGLKYQARKMEISEVKKFLDRNIPVILDLQAWSGKKVLNWGKHWQDGHYVVAIGYDQKKLYFEDSFSFKRTFLGYEELFQRWHDQDARGRKYFQLGIAVYGKKTVFKFNNVEQMG